MQRYDDEFDWRADVDRAAARRAIWTGLALTFAFLLAALAFLI